MVILDTNVLSELSRTKPSPIVMRWIDGLDRDDTYITAISKAEALYGLEYMPAGKRKSDMTQVYYSLFTTTFRGKVLPFEDEACRTFAQLAAHARRKGRTLSTADLQIASIAILHRSTVATRNKQDFEHEGLDVIDPWVEASP